MVSNDEQARLLQDFPGLDQDQPLVQAGVLPQDRRLPGLQLPLQKQRHRGHQGSLWPRCGHCGQGIFGRVPRHGCGFEALLLVRCLPGQERLLHVYLHLGVLPREADRPLRRSARADLL